MNRYSVMITAQAEEQIREIAYHIAVNHNAPDAAENLIDELYETFDQLKLDAIDQIMTTKLTAILRVATGLARNTRKSIDNISVQLKDKELVIKVGSKDKMLLEKGLFRERTDTFEEAFGITPVLKVIKAGTK